MWIDVAPKTYKVDEPKNNIFEHFIYSIYMYI